MELHMTTNPTKDTALPSRKGKQYKRMPTLPSPNILFQRLGNKIYAFTVKNEEVYWVEITPPRLNI